MRTPIVLPILGIAAALILVPAALQAQIPVWNANFGDSDVQYGIRVDTDGSGNVLLTGTYRGSVDFGGGPLVSAGGGKDVFLAKFDAAGNHLWSGGFGDWWDDVGYGVTVDATDNVIVTGTSRNQIDFGLGPLDTEKDVVVAKFAPAILGFPERPSGTVSRLKVFPNPLRHAATIELAASVSGSVRLGVYDVQGREVRRLWDGSVDGQKRFTWNGTGRGGARVAPGIYFVRLETVRKTERLKIVVAP